MRSILLSLLCVSAMSSAAECGYGQIKGDHFQFAKRSSAVSMYGYQFWHEQPSITAATLEYKKYNGVKGKITHEYISNMFGTRAFRKAVTERCDVVFMETRSDMALDGVLLSKDLDRARNLIGKSIWVDQGLTDLIRLYTADPAVSYPLTHLEELTVVDVDVDYYGHGRGSGAFQLKVRKKNGEEGFIRYNTIYFFERFPAF